MKLGKILFCAIFAVGFASSPASASVGDADVLQRSLVFNLGDNGSKYYRIPAIVTLEDGTLVAVADKRIENNWDLPGKIDVVCRTSSDNGATWTPAVTVAEHNDDGGYGDPALVIDRNSGDILCIATHGQGLWTATPGNSARIVVMSSKDNGLTWSEPLDITEQFFTSTGEAGKPVKG
ncbi:MAG: glycoside hydrolase, partial [Muribaculaceae bacterium]|nr:glycoside hydrolase [Muribaculaceae bacterium]